MAGYAEQVIQTEAQTKLSSAPLVRKAAPAAVNINVKTAPASRTSLILGDPFRALYFRDFGCEQPRAQNSLGSGVIPSENGVVAANSHFVDTARDIRLVLSDRRAFHAGVFLGDADSDLANLWVEGVSGVSPLPLRASDMVEVGELVLVTGNPFGMGQTVSRGIVSGLARAGTAARSGLGYFFRTDAPINPGNSGGTLIEVSGDLIAINTSVLTLSGGSNGGGFLIPADLVAASMGKAQQGKNRFEQPRAGMSGQSVDPENAQVFGLARPEAIVVLGLLPVRPVARAAVAVSDIITAVGGEPLYTPVETIYRVSAADPGQRAAAGIMCAGQRVDAEVALVQASDPPPCQMKMLSARAVLERFPRAGAIPAVIAQYSLALESADVVLTQPGPLGRRVGLQCSDVILSVNSLATKCPKDLEDALQARAARFDFDVIRGATWRMRRIGV